MASRAACKHTSMHSMHVSCDTFMYSLSYNPKNVANADNDRWNLWILYLGNSYRAAIELGDALVGLVTSLPHPIILHRI